MAHDCAHRGESEAASHGLRGHTAVMPSGTLGQLFEDRGGSIFVPDIWAEKILNKKLARRFVIACAVIILIVNPYL